MIHREVLGIDLEMALVWNSVWNSVWLTLSPRLFLCGGSAELVKS